MFRSGEDGYATYRIPAIVETADGTLVAFAEGRVSTAADDGNVDLLAKRSSDGGRTWGELQVVADMGSDFIGNPSPVLDEESGRLVVLATGKAGTDTEAEIMTGTGADTSREYLLTSDDDGQTWSEPSEITDSVKSPDWRWYSVGPGHAVQIRSGDHEGRLVAAANHSDGALNYGAHLLLSDDGGATWRIGATDTPQGGPHHPNEATAAVLANGTIVVST
ncbi:MAG: glycoside hydrolase [Microthrixaceae bacterium]|nr:glycoside hydrolase [Microthrixaceae bacterium]